MSLEANFDAAPKHERNALQAGDAVKSGAHNEINAMPASEQKLSRNSALDNATMNQFGFPTPQIIDANGGHMNGALGGEQSDRRLINGPKQALQAHLGDSLNDRVVKTVAGNEGSLNTITKNDAGHGMSVGIRQWNQKRGELPDLLKSWHDKNPEKFDKTFGSHAKDLLSERYVRHANLSGNKDIVGKMKTALNDPEFQQVQVDKFRQFADKSADTAKHYGLKSEMGAALVADISNQMGEAGVRKVMRRAGLHQGGEVKDEAAALKAMEHATHRPHSSTRFNLLASSFSPERRRPSAPLNDAHTYTAALDMVTGAIV